uniref:Chromo domain-containing protein n=1 Tax=Glossina brevipalpis TaxID=37001 RepID=A0A1A9WL15_9MUSC
MESKNEDSGGSDSLDKTLQQKCKMDDVGQGEGKPELTAINQVDSGGDGANVRDKPKENDLGQCEQQQNSSSKPQKTETYLMGDGINAAATEARESSLRFFKASSTISNTIFSREDSDSSSSSNSVNNSINSSSSSHKIKCTGSHNIETRVTQISQNLQETSLETLFPALEGDKSATAKLATEENTNITPTITSTATPSDALPGSSTSSTALLENEQPGTSRSNSATNSDSTLSHSELDSSSLAANDSMEDASDHRSKKVRFHPDAKENDGGNRIIPKKKKKIKLQPTDESPSVSAKVSGNDSTDMEFDEGGEEEMYEEEEEFDVEKTIVESENYLKLHPITFVPSPALNTSTRVPTSIGIMKEEDLQSEEKINDQLEEETELEFIAENGIECILGKKTINGECSYLLRYADKTGLFWEPEDFIYKNCPKLLNKYEESQQIQQDRLMCYVAQRQNLRQGYTDF